MSTVKDYSKTKTACYLGFVTQAIVANFPPLLFMAFHREYELPIASLALIPAVFYIVQLVTDLLTGFRAVALLRSFDRRAPLRVCLCRRKRPD